MNKKTVFISLAGLLGIIFIMFFSLKKFKIIYSERGNRGIKK